MKENFYIVNRDNSNEKCYPVNIYDVNVLANFVLTLHLESIDHGPTLEDSYLNALNRYFANFSIKDEIRSIYDKITSDQFGRKFLKTSIAIVIFEQYLRENGIDNKSKELYTKLLKEYKEELNFNNSLYSINDIKTR